VGVVRHGRDGGEPAIEPLLMGEPCQCPDDEGVLGDAGLKKGPPSFGDDVELAGARLDSLAHDLNSAGVESWKHPQVGRSDLARVHCDAVDQVPEKEAVLGVSRHVGR
jgi:hypothetical protein